MRAISAILLLAALPACAQPDSLEKGIAEFHRGEYAAAQASLEKAADSPQRRAFLALARAAGGHCDAARPDLAKQFAETPDTDLRRLSWCA
jgi:hypothetical protein